MGKKETVYTDLVFIINGDVDYAELITAYYDADGNFHINANEVNIPIYYNGKDIRKEDLILTDDYLRKYHTGEYNPDKGCILYHREVEVGFISAESINQFDRKDMICSIYCTEINDCWQLITADMADDLMGR